MRIAFSSSICAAAVDCTGRRFSLWDHSLCQHPLQLPDLICRLCVCQSHNDPLLLLWCHEPALSALLAAADHAQLLRCQVMRRAGHWSCRRRQTDRQGVGLFGDWVDEHLLGLCSLRVFYADEVQRP